jgi:heat-inducible transcriptional repressor
MEKSQKNIALLNDREQQILRFTVQAYIDSAKPVGSKFLSKQYFQELSPATIRNVLAHLEKEGFLLQPYPSAGRIPTEKGFRFFIESLMKPKTLTRQEKKALQWSPSTHTHSLETIQETSRFLSLFSQQIGMVSGPRLETSIFKKIEFVLVGSEKILVIFISENDILEQRLVSLKDPPSPDELLKMSRYLNETLSRLAHSNWGEIQRVLEIELKNAKRGYQNLLRKLFANPEENPEVFIEGQSHLAEQPEFSDRQRLSALFQAFKQKQLLLKILERADQKPEKPYHRVQIVLGEDLKDENFQGLSFVTRLYGPSENPLGAVAIAGPTRMDYSYMVPLVNFAVDHLNKYFVQ